MRNEARAACADTWFEDGLRWARRCHLSLVCAIGTAQYFEAWLAALQLRLALEAAGQLVADLAAASQAEAARRIGALRALALPMLALAPSPTSREIRQLRTSDPHADRCAWDEAEQRWRRCVLAARFGEPGNVAPGRN